MLKTSLILDLRAFMALDPDNKEKQELLVSLLKTLKMSPFKYDPKDRK